MAKADTLPTAVQGLITGTIASASTKPFPQAWQHRRAELEREDLHLGVGTTAANRCAAGPMPFGWQVVAVCYATASILLGWWPWNFLLLLLLFPINNKRVGFYAFRSVAATESMRRRESYSRGSPT